ncbi:MAG: indole-3-glycerol-phosphate synthase [Leptospiraceae bacterium]|nr:indole-3-glycerol-phosphate synthase [Leptospiraceae bacterium]MDW8307238.1 indole-3-glycerol-phosphate synthase [Leptospiraceae bacterium]
MSVLAKILENRKKSLPSPVFYRGLAVAKTQRSFAEAIRKKGDRISLIAELKRKSPSQGNLKENANVREVYEIYRPYAQAISVLTEPNFFSGSLEDLREMRQLTELPLLRKDFIIDPVQVKEARYYGADAYLLIAAALSQSQLKELLEAGKELGMEALVEVQNETELEWVLELNIKILGVNNRNLHDLSLDLGRAPALFGRIPEERKKGLILVAESGYSNREDLKTLPPETDAVLIGSSLMQAKNPRQLLQEMFG